MYKTLWRESKTPWALVSLGLHLFAAWASEGFYFWDEHYQVLEFANALLSKTYLKDLAWEYHHQIRSWLQPVLYAGPMAGLKFLGIHDPHVFAFVFRLGTGLVSWVALIALVAWVRKWNLSRNLERAVVSMTCVAWLLPYLNVRTSSETLSGSLLVIGSAVLLGFEGGFLAGIIFGLSFFARFQSAFFILGLVAWIWFYQPKTRIATLGRLLLGGLVASAFCTLIDSLCYGSFVLTPWKYFDANILQGISKQFGEKPFWFYLVFVGRTFPPFGLLVWIGTFLFLWKYRRHPLAWGVALFLAGHHAAAHKELRFLFPLAQLVPLMTVLGFNLKIPTVRSFGFFALAAPQIAATLILCGFWTFPLQLPLLRTISNSGQNWELWSRGYTPHPFGVQYDFVLGIRTHFYNPTHVRERVFNSYEQWNTMVLETSSLKLRKPFWFIGTIPENMNSRCRLVQSVWPRWTESLPYRTWWLTPFGNSHLYACDEKNL